MRKVYCLLSFFVVLSISLRAQGPVICVALPHSSGFISYANINSRIEGNSSQRLGITKNMEKIFFDCTWDGTQASSDLSKIKLTGAVIKVHMDNDSTMVFDVDKISQVLKFQSKQYLSLVARMTYDQAVSLKLHKLTDIYLVTDKKQRYNLFIFNDQEKADIQKMADCFLSNVKPSN